MTRKHDRYAHLTARAKVKALEAAQQFPASSLVERVGAAIFKQFEINAGNEAEARAAISEIARWIDAEAHERGLQPHNGVYAAADWLRGQLEQDADQ